MGRLCPIFLSASARLFSNRQDTAYATPANRSRVWSSRLARVGFKKGGGVHSADEHAAIQTVAVIHHAPDAVGIFVGLLRQTRRHHPDEIGFDLEINVIGV